MTKSVNTRELVLDILTEVTVHEQYSHLVIRQMLKKHQYLEKQDRAFLSRLAEGTIEQLIQIDYIINLYSSVKTTKMKPVIRNIIRMSVYQLLFMDSIPDSAACNEAVKLAVKRGFGSLKGFVNGVLRTVARNREDIPYPDEKKNLLTYLSVRYSMPEWIVNKWITEYNREITEKMLQAFLNEKKTTVRCNVGRASMDEIIKELELDGIQTEACPYLSTALTISGYDYIEKVKAFQKGYIQVQDLSSMLVATIADPEPGSYVIDVCAAPGGKSLHIAELMKETGFVEARDLTEAKTLLIQENINRSGTKNIAVKVMDATIADPDSIEKADIVIADLPCSGLGVIGKKADIKYKVDEDKLVSLVKLQREILQNVQNYVKPGGYLIYSTCTINKEENEENCKWFLEKFPYKPVNIEGFLSEDLHSDTTKEGFVQLLPGIHKTDGFFIAKFRKEEL